MAATENSIKKKNLLEKVINKDLLKKVSLEKQRDQLLRIGKDRI